MSHLDQLLGSMVCSFCGAKAIDVTTNDDDRRRYMCAGTICHGWQDGDEPPEPEPEPDLNIEEIIKAEVERRVAEALPPKAPSFAQRALARFRR